MKFKTLTDKESKDLINSYYTLRDLIDEIHDVAYKLFESSYQDYVNNFNPTVLYFFTRKLLTFDEYISGYDDFGDISIKEFSGKKYLQLYYFYSPNNTHNLAKFSDKEEEVIRVACKYGLDVYKKHNKYINRLVRYAEHPLHLGNDDFDNFDMYAISSKRIKEVLDNYKALP